MSDLSALEQYFPRLVPEIVALWRTPAGYARLQDLLLDGRGGRQGFPPDVYFELSLLLELTPRPPGPYDIWNDAADAEQGG